MVPPPFLPTSQKPDALVPPTPMYPLSPTPNPGDFSSLYAHLLTFIHSFIHSFIFISMNFHYVPDSVLDAEATEQAVIPALTAFTHGGKLPSFIFWNIPSQSSGSMESTPAILWTILYIAKWIF